MFSNTNIEWVFLMCLLCCLKKKGMKAISFKTKREKKNTRDNKACFVTNLDELNNAGSTARSTHGTRAHGGKTGVRLTRRPSPCESVAKSRKWGQPIKKKHKSKQKKDNPSPPCIHGGGAAREGGRGAGLRWLASLAAHIHHEHKCETVPKISDQVASCSRYDSRQKKKKTQKGKKKNQRRRRSWGELRNNELQCQDNCKTRCDIYPCT